LEAQIKMTAIDLAKFTFTAEQIRDINELAFDDILKAPDLNLITTLYPGIVYDKEIGFIGEGGLVGVARQGCKPTPQDWNIATRKVVWEPKAWEVLLDECWTTLESTCVIYAMKTGVDVADLSTTDYYAIVSQVLKDAIKKFIIRMFWFGDLDASHVSDGGIITDSFNTSYFTILNGFWKQLMEQSTANPSQKVVITENAASTYAAQELSPESAKKYLQQLKYKAPILLRSKTEGFIACTQTVYDAWEQWNQGKELESLYTNLLDGTKVIKAFGIPLIPMPVWDEMIAQFENTGTKLNNPHRALYVTKDILAVGVDGTNSFENMNVWYEKKDRMVYTELMGRADAKLLNPAMFQLAV